MADIGKNIKRLRGEKGLSQDQLAEKLFVSRQTVSNYEMGKTQPDIEMLQQLAAIFDTNIETLIYGPRPDPARRQIITALCLAGGAVLAAVLGIVLQKIEIALYADRYYSISGRLLIGFFFYPLAYFLGGMAFGSLIHLLLKKVKGKVLTVLFMVTNLPAAVYGLILSPFIAAELWGRIRMWAGLAARPDNPLLGAADPNSYTLLQMVFNYIVSFFVYKYNKFFLFAIPGLCFGLWWQWRKNRDSTK